MYVRASCAGFWLLVLSLLFWLLCLLASRVIVTVLYNAVFTAMFSMQYEAHSKPTPGAFSIPISAEVFICYFQRQVYMHRAVFEKEKAKKARKKKQARFTHNQQPSWGYASVRWI